MDVLVGTSASIRVDFQTPNGLAVPDTGTVLYSLYANDGTLLVTDQALSPGNNTGVAVNINQSHHTIGVGKRFEKRILYVKFEVGGQTYRIRRAYRVVPLLLFTATPDDVRTFTGLNADELADEEIDLFTAYLSVEEEVTKTALDTALTAGTTLEQAANLAIILTAVIAVIPGAKVRAATRISDGANSFERSDKIDFDRIGADAARLRGDLIRTLTGATETIPSVVIFGGATDPITGA